MLNNDFISTNIETLDLAEDSNKSVDVLNGGDVNKAIDSMSIDVLFSRDEEGLNKYYSLVDEKDKLNDINIKYNNLYSEILSEIDNRKNNLINEVISETKTLEESNEELLCKINELLGLDSNSHVASSDSIEVLDEIPDSL